MGRSLWAISRTIRRRSGEAKAEVLALTEQTGEMLERSVREAPSGRLIYDAATDGCFPLISNDRQLTDPELLGAYRYQPTSRNATTSSKASSAPPPWS